MIIILTLVGLSIHFLFTHFLIREAETNAVNIGKALLHQENKILINDHKSGKRFIEIDENEISLFDQRVRESLNIFNIAKLKIFTPEGKIVYSTDTKIIGRFDKYNMELNSALVGKVSSKLESESTVWDLMEEQKMGTEMVETYLPIKDQDNNIIGVYEIYMDISAYKNEVKYALGATIGIFFFILILVFCVLRIFMSRAIKMIYSKSQDIHILRGLLPICSFCKKIKNDAGDWEIFEKYISARSESQFSHGLCPDCKKEHYHQLSSVKSSNKEDNL